jgi:microcystin-dependent protein
MPTPFVGEIRIFAGSFAPTGWAFCNGQLLAISSNTALFSIIGTTYGGNGVSTFALPDLRGRVPMAAGRGLGLSPRSLGNAVGYETHALIGPEMPIHTHSLAGSAGNGTTDSPAGAVLARSPAAIPQFQEFADATMHSSTVGTSGGGQPHNNMQPYLALNFIIALQGVFPSRWP